MNTRREKAKFKNVGFLLDSGFNSTIVTRRLKMKLKTKEDDVMQRKTQSDNITINIKVRIYLTLTEFSMTQIVI